MVGVPPEVYELVRLDLDMAKDSGILVVRKQIISTFSFYMVRPNAAHTITITPVIFLSCSGKCETTPALSA